MSDNESLFTHFVFFFFFKEDEDPPLVVTIEESSCPNHNYMVGGNQGYAEGIREALQFKKREDLCPSNPGKGR